MNKGTRRCLLVFVLAIVVVLSSFSLALAGEQSMDESYYGGFMHDYAGYTNGQLIVPSYFPVHVIAPHITTAAGSVIDITISLNGLHGGLSTLSFDFGYDATKLERVSEVALGSVFNRPIVQPPLGANPFRINFGMVDILGVTHTHGDLATVRFRVLDDVEPGVTTPIEISLVSAYRIENFMPIPVTVWSANGSVTIIETITHPITIVDGRVGAYANPNPAEVGETVRINAGATPAGHIFAGWTTDTPGVIFTNHPTAGNVASFQMPDEPVVVTANWYFPITANISASHERANRGRYVDVNVSLDEVEALSSMSLSVRYDRDVLERVSITPANLMLIPVQPSPGANPFIMSFSLANPIGVITETGNLATIRFRILNDADLGVTPIELSLVSAYRIENFSVIPVGATATDGSVHVTNIMFGDVNGDGMITDADLLMLRMYLAGHPVNIDREAADVNVDGQVTSADELLLAMYLAGHPVVLGPQSNPGPAQLQSAAFNGFEITYLLDAHGVFDENLLSQDALAGFEATYSENYSDNRSSVEYVDVVISLNENEGISTLSLDLNYDASVLQRVSIAPTGIMLMPVEPPVKAYPFTMNFSLSDPLAFTGDTGNLVTVRFKVLDNTALETTPITLGVNSAYRIENFSPVPVNVTELGIQAILQDSSFAQ